MLPEEPGLFGLGKADRPDGSLQWLSVGGGQVEFHSSSGTLLFPPRARARRNLFL